MYDFLFIFLLFIAVGAFYYILMCVDPNSNSVMAKLHHKFYVTLPSKAK